MFFADRYSPEDLVEEVENFQPIIIDCSVLASELETVLVINNMLKSCSKHNTVSVFGGLHCTFAVDGTIRRDGVDALSVSEGEKSYFYKILQSLRARGLLGGI